MAGKRREVVEPQDLRLIFKAYVQANPDAGREEMKAFEAIGKAHLYTSWAVESALRSTNRPRSQREQDEAEAARIEAARLPERDLLREGERAAARASETLMQFKIMALVLIPLCLLLAYCATYDDGSRTDAQKRTTLCAREGRSC